MKKYDYLLNQTELRTREAKPLDIHLFILYSCKYFGNNKAGLRKKTPGRVYLKTFMSLRFCDYRVNVTFFYTT